MIKNRKNFLRAHYEGLMAGQLQAILSLSRPSATTMLEKEFQHYIKNQAELLKKFEGKFLVIVGEEVVGAYASEIEAYQEAQKKGYQLGTFLIQKCLPGKESYTQTFHSRVVI